MTHPASPPNGPPTRTRRRGPTVALRVIVLGVAAGLGAVCVAMVAPDPALAKLELGKTIGGELRSWATGLLLSAAALVGIPALIKKNPSELGMLAFAVLVVGGFALAPSVVESIIQGLWKAFAGA